MRINFKCNFVRVFVISEVKTLSSRFSGWLYSIIKINVVSKRDSVIIQFVNCSGKVLDQRKFINSL